MQQEPTILEAFETIVRSGYGIAIISTIFTLLLAILRLFIKNVKQTINTKIDNINMRFKAFEKDFNEYKEFMEKLCDERHKEKN